MSEIEFQTGIEESVSMVKRGQRLPRKPCYFVPEEEMARIEAMKAAPKQAAENLAGSAVALRLAHAVIPVMIGATWILGAAEGLADPVFTGVITALCILWGVCNYKWGAIHA